MDDQQLLAGIVGGLIGWLICMIAFTVIVAWLYPVHIIRGKGPREPR